jgi:hypothetical protein
MIPSNKPPTVTELAVATAGQLNSLSQTIAADPFRIRRALHLLHCDTPIAVCTTLCLDRTVAKQFYVLVKDRIRVVTCPTQATDSSNEAVCLANLGDQLDDYRPISFSPKEFGGYVITLFHKGTVAKYGIPFSVSNPVTLSPPTGGQPGDKRLHWTPILEPVADIPCFGALLLACRILAGDPAFDGLPILDDLNPSTLTAAPMFTRWFAGIQYLQQHHHGVSLHAGDTLFTWAAVNASEFAGLPLRISPATMLDGIATLDEHLNNMSAIFKAEQLVAYFRSTQHGTPALHALPTVQAPRERSRYPNANPALACAASFCSSPNHYFRRAQKS